MVIGKLALTILWILGAVISGQELSGAELLDPMANLLPVSVSATQSQTRDDEKQQPSDFDINQTPTNKEESSEILSTSVTSSVSSGPPGRLSIEQDGIKLSGTTSQSANHERQRGSDQSHGQCSYTFIVPQNPALCMNSQTSVTSQSDDRFLVEVQRDVFTAKTQIEMIREEILEAREELPSARAVTSIQNDVNRLQKEVLVMNNGIQQINLRIAEETSIKKDNDLDIQLLENKILNQNVRYLQLKQEHEQLKNDHNALRAQLLRQSDVIESLRQIVESLAVGSREVIPVEELASRQHDQPLKEVRRPPTTSAPLSRGPFRDCTEAQRAGHTRSGVFRILVPRMRRRIKVWCDFEQDPGGWTTIQSRVGEKVNFYRNMAAYKKGFGDKKKQEFWLGLENIHRLTNQTEVNYKLHIDLEDWDGRRTFVEYESFRVESERDGYKLKITHYSGNAGDALTPHNNMKFTARDLDRDLFHENCAQRLHGGWWYKACGQSNLNGFYHKRGEHGRGGQDGVYWSEWRGTWYSLKSVAMKIRPTD